ALAHPDPELERGGRLGADDAPDDGRGGVPGSRAVGRFVHGDRTYPAAVTRPRMGRDTAPPPGAAGAPSAGQEGEAHLAPGVVDVQVDEADALPGAEGQA